MRYLLIIIGLFGLTYAQTYTISLNGNVVEFTNDITSQVYYSYNACELSYREYADDDFEICDNQKCNGFDIDKISNYASTSVLIADLNAWILACTSGGASPDDTSNVFVTNDSLKVFFSQPIYDIDTSYNNEFERQNDTLSGILNALKSQSDTIYSFDLDSSYVSLLNDSLKVYFNQPIEVLDNDFDSVYVQNFPEQKDTLYTYDLDSSFVEVTNLSSIEDTLSNILTQIIKLDTTQIDTNNLQPLIDSLTTQNLERKIQLDSLITLLQKDTTTDTIKVAVFDTYLDAPTTADTLYNCYGVGFSWLPTATGSVTILADNGVSVVFPAGSSMPFWNEGYIEKIYYDATSATGFIVNGKNCKVTNGNPCVTLKPLDDCESGTPIETCEGWQSINGVWQSLSGCWNSNE